jgi:hypothetical protein
MTAPEGYTTYCASIYLLASRVPARNADVRPNPDSLSRATSTQMWTVPSSHRHPRFLPVNTPHLSPNQSPRNDQALLEIP